MKKYVVIETITSYKNEYFVEMTDESEDPNYYYLKYLKNKISNSHNEKYIGETLTGLLTIDEKQYKK